MTGEETLLLAGIQCCQ